MSNQGWSQLPHENKTVGDKVFAAVTWPFRKLFGAIAPKLLSKFNPRRR